MKKVGVTCVTYRNPNSDPFVRVYGIVSLIKQMGAQDYAGPIGVSIVDDSPTPHEFAQSVAAAKPDKVLYTHAPSREALRQIVLQQAPSAAKFVPSDDILRRACVLMLQERIQAGDHIIEADLKLAKGDFNLSQNEWAALIQWENDPAGGKDVSLSAQQFLAAQDGKGLDDTEVLFWKDRLSQVRAYAHLVPFEEDYPFQTNILPSIFQERPTIGMKKNVGNALSAHHFGEPEVLVYADDDDQHAPDYVSKSVKALGDADFTRMTRYLTYVYNKDAAQGQQGRFELNISKAANGYWYLFPEERTRPMYLWISHKGKFTDSKIGRKFSRPTMLAWPIISHEGALHTYSFDSWKRSVDSIGGATPVSFCEDIIGFRMQKDWFGNAFRDVHTPIEKGNESFIRIADGNNASVIEFTDRFDGFEEWPTWAVSAIQDLHKASDTPGYTTAAVQKQIAADYVGYKSFSVVKAPALQP